MTNSETFLTITDGWETFFKQCYAIVTSRSVSLNGLKLVPLFDCMEHSHSDKISHHMVNKKLHLDPVEDKAYMDSAKYLNDVRLLYRSGNS